jgi:gliding motility-associated-like protein
MNKKLRYCICLLISFLSISATSNATHIMGGSLNYQYLGLDSVTGNYNYQVTIYLYRLCDMGSALLPIDMNLGIYQDDPQNPLGDKLLVASAVVPLILQQGITPPASDSCSFAPNVCVEEGVYQLTVSVPPNTTGYYFFSDRCCRNNNIVNLNNPGNDGEAYFAKAPAPTVVNSSPVFAVAPVPFICNTDTASILNQAFDPDGDLLVYNFAVPYNGISTGGNPNPPPPGTYPYPVPLVGYAPGYSLANPFGATGYAFMNTSTGLAQYYSPNQGFYVVAVEISEYRNGVLIGISRRDIQIIVIACPLNPAPVLQTGSQTIYTIQEGDTLCFNTIFNDPNNDSIFITHTGDIFNNVITNPPATFSDASGLGTATGQFCWNTSCDQGNAVPYQFSVFATDNGCPAKITSVVYTINVQNTPDPGPITGPDTLCGTANGIIYWVPALPGNTFSWTVTNGTIIGPANGDSIVVNFSGTGIATISVTAANSNGCPSNIITKQVILSAVPTAVAGPDVAFCSGGSAILGTNPTTGYVYTWTPGTGLSSTTVSNPTVTGINIGSTPISTTYILTTNFGGCTNSDTVVVTINPQPAPSAGPDVVLCSGNTAVIGTVSIPGYIYVWNPSNGLSDTTISNPIVTLIDTTGLPYTVQYVVTVQNSYGCSSIDTVNVTVNVVPVAAAGPDVSFCSGSSATLGAPPVSGYAYSWNPVTGLSSSTSGNPTVTLTNLTGQNDTIYYIVTVTLGNCTDIDSVQVIVKPNPVSNAGPDHFLCGSGTIQLGTSSTTGYTYTWSPGTSLSSTIISDPVLTYNNSGNTPDTLTYVVTTTLNGCVTSDTVQIIIGPNATAVAGPDVSLCSGSSVTIGAASQANYIYTWTPSTWLNNSSISDPTVTPINSTGINDTLTYILTVDLFGCPGSDTVQVIVKPNPVSEAGTNATVCGGDTVQLGTASTAGYVYTWTPATGLSSTTISDPILIVSNSGTTPIIITYTVTTNLNGCITSDSVTITINPEPNVTATANPVSICDGGSATLTGSGATTYSWALSTSPNNPISTDSVLVVNPTVTTTYILTGSNGFSCSNSDTITVTVNALPAVQITAPSDSICSGDTLTLTATGATNYSWSISGGINLGTGSSIQVSPTTNTTYVVVGTDGNSCSNSDSIRIIVNPAPTITGASGTVSVCPGVNGVMYWVNNPNPNSTYTWTVTNGTIASGQNTDTITVNWSGTSGIGTVSVIEVTDRGCVSDPVNLPVTINVLLTPVAPAGPTTLCANQALGILYSALNTAGSTYNWFAQGGVIVSGNGTSDVTVNWNVTGPQTVLLWYDESSITSVDTCFGVSDTLHITINPTPVTSPISGPIDVCLSDSGSFSVINTSNSTYNWFISNGTILSGNGSNSISANWTTSGSVIVSVIETNVYGCVGDTVSLPVTIHAAPSVSAGPDVGVCIGQSVQLNATGGVSYIWSPSTGLSNINIPNPVANPTTATQYMVFVTDTFGCRNSDTVLVTVNPLPVITHTPDSPVCIGSSIQLTAGGGSTYQWSPADSLNNPNISNPVANPSTTTTYTVVVTDQNTCVDSATVTITVNPLPIITALGDTTICAGTSASISAGGGVSYSWAPASSLNNSNVSNPLASPSSTTTYIVTGTDANGCANTAQVIVSVNVQPQASFTVDDANLDSLTCLGYTGNLVNTSVDALNYQWLFPNESTTTDVNPQVHLNLSGSNNITLIAINNMCQDTFMLDFASTAIGQFFKQVPNVFTPNGDLKNDCFDFGPQFNLKDCSEWEVYNRWGEKVFTSSPGQPCWNGRQDGNGKELPVGTYYILVKIASQSYKGSITLLR